MKDMFGGVETAEALAVLEQEVTNNGKGRKSDRMWSELLKRRLSAVDLQHVVNHIPPYATRAEALLRKVKANTSKKQKRL